MSKNSVDTKNATLADDAPHSSESAFPSLSDILCLLEQKLYLVSSSIPLSDARNIKVRGAASDSREVSEGNLFVCKGAHFEKRFLLDALEKGASAIMCGQEEQKSIEEILQTVAPSNSLDAHSIDSTTSATPGTPLEPATSTDAATPATPTHPPPPHHPPTPPTPVPLLVVNSLRPATAEVAALAWAYPNRELKVIGVTGTKGKSTTTSMVKALLDEATDKNKVAFMGTHQIFNGEDTLETPNTTPEPCDLWRILHEAYAAGCEYVVMEVSSQGLKYDRTLGLTFDVGCFLNIAPDHISEIEHPTFEDYFASKLRLFSQSKTAIVNLDSDHLSEIETFLVEKSLVPVTVSLENDEADFFASNISVLSNVTHDMVFVAHTPTWTEKLVLSMSGKHNVFDALAALAIAENIGIKKDALVAAAKKTFQEITVPGRMEIFASADERLIGVVDYAHTAESFEAFFETMKKDYPGAYVIAMFGVSGGKAKNRYVDLPRVASKFADFIILTSDDPGPINPEELVNEISFSLGPGTSFEKEADREKALELAFGRAKEVLQINSAIQVVLCALGKGAETTMRIGQEDISYEPDNAHMERLIKTAI